MYWPFPQLDDAIVSVFKFDVAFLRADEMEGWALLEFRDD